MKPYVCMLLAASALANPKVVVLVSANAEWAEVKKLHPKATYQKGPYGEYFYLRKDVLIAQGGWGKISAAASAQYAIDRWNPATIVNLGTCGGIAGRVERYAILAVTRTIVYDIVEQMGDPAEAIGFYSTEIDLSWSGDLPGIRTPLLSADRDLIPQDIPALTKRYNVIAVDWESGAIAWVARRNQKRVVILRGVSDLVSPESGGQAYGGTGEFESGAARVMQDLFQRLPSWLAKLPR